MLTFQIILLLNEMNVKSVLKIYFLIFYPIDIFFFYSIEYDS